MKKILLFFILVAFCSCFIPHKEYLSPSIELKIYDSITKKPMEGVQLLKKNTKDSVNKVQDKYFHFSDKKGNINIRPEYYRNKTNRKIMRPLNNYIILKKEGYIEKQIDMFQYFKINEFSDLSKKYVADSIFLQRK
ncbi:hypothetical protein AB4Y90_11995 [Chryseobacterium sp. 2TAF14]|uniref:hypothetical protein n=1 Tax=Chryseobacterium sp. 2TAF14 TaxID=3233007 RepID=UPI003F919A8F